LSCVKKNHFYQKIFQGTFAVSENIIFFAAQKFSAGIDSEEK